MSRPDRGVCPTHGSINIEWEDGGIPVCPKCNSLLTIDSPKVVIHHTPRRVLEERPEPRTVFVVVLHGPMDRRCWVSHKSHDLDTARDIAATKSWTLDGHALLFRGKVEPRHIVRWYIKHSRVSNHPGYYEHVPKPESKPEYRSSRMRTEARFQCPHCRQRPVRPLRGVQGRDTICVHCHKIWMKP